MYTDNVECNLYRNLPIFYSISNSKARHKHFTASLCVNFIINRSVFFFARRYRISSELSNSMSFLFLTFAPIQEDYRKITVERKGETNFFTSEMIKACMRKCVTVNLHQVVQVWHKLFMQQMERIVSHWVYSK